MKIYGTMIVFATILLASAQFSAAQPETLTLQDKALDYIENVLPLDFNHYKVTLQSYETLPSTETQVVSYSLNSSDSSLTAIVMFTNGAVQECDLRVRSGSAVNKIPYANMTTATGYILCALENYTGLDTSRFVKTLNMLGSSTNVTDGNLNLSVSGFKLSYVVDATIFQWTYSWKGIPFADLSIEFNKGSFYRLRNNLDHTLGDTTVNITRYQAIDIASNYLASYIFTQASTNRTVTFSGNQTLQDAHLDYSVLNNNTFIPRWLVLYNLGTTLSDGYVTVAVLAGSGQISDAQANGSSLHVIASNPAKTETEPSNQSA